MTKLAYIFLVNLITSCYIGQNNYTLEKIFLNLKYSNDIRTMFDSIEKNQNFKLNTPKKYFIEDAGFYAKYIGRSDLYLDADSIIVHILTCNDMGTFFKDGANNCKSLKILYYLKDTSLIKSNYLRLDNIIKSAIVANDPNWKNHEGASKGAYFLSNKIYPFITLDKHTFRGNYLKIEYTKYDR